MSVVKVSITPTQWLAPVAAAQYARMIADGCPGGITEAGRTRAYQQHLFDEWRAGRLNVPSVAKPGTSLHEKGIALDLPEPARSWVRAHGAAYGWHADRVPGEPWHFEFTPTATTAPQEADMPLTEQDVKAVAHVVFTTTIERDKPVPLLQDWADTGTIARQILAAVKGQAAPVIDYDVLAAKVVERLPLAQLAKAVNDDAAQRMQG